MKSNSTPKLLLLLLIISILFSTIVIAQEPTQQFNKIFLNPFYRQSMSQNTNYNYVVDITPPDKISKVNSAIISFDVYINPSISFSLLVNDNSCNNPIYNISTTFSSAGQSRITFDCSNVITKTGSYNIVLRPSLEIGRASCRERV